MFTYRIEAKEIETGLMELATAERFTSPDSARAWADEFYGPDYTGVRLEVSLEENGEAQVVVWTNGVSK